MSDIGNIRFAKGKCGYRSAAILVKHVNAVRHMIDPSVQGEAERWKSSTNVRSDRPRR